MFRCSNPDCRCGTFYRHGTYTRYFISLPDESLDVQDTLHTNPLSAFDQLEILQLTILRVRCTGCGQTHAILPDDVVPFHSFSTVLYLMILFAIFHHNASCNSQKTVLHQTGSLSWQFLHALLLAYRSYRSRMDHVLRAKGIYTSETAPSDCVLLSLYLSPEFQARTLFLHYFSMQLFLTRRDTVSYPIRIIIP